MQPYEAWFFYAADDASEVETEYRRIMGVLRPGGIRLQPELTDPVTVVAGEHRNATEYVWFIRDGLLECRESWQVRAISPLT